MAIVKKLEMVGDLKGTTGKADPFYDRKARDGYYIQHTKKGAIALKKNNPGKRQTTDKQKKQRLLFALADCSYNFLNEQQKLLFKRYTKEWNEKNGKNLSPPALWKHLALTGKLNEFFEKWLGLEIQDFKIEETAEEFCFETLIKTKDYDKIMEELYMDIMSLRR